VLLVKTLNKKMKNRAGADKSSLMSESTDELRRARLLPVDSEVLSSWFPIRIPWNSIYRKLLVTYLALTALGTSLLASYILWSFYGYFMKTRQADLDAWTTALSESVADSLEENELQRVELLVKRYGTPDFITLRVFTPDGRLLFTSAPDLDRQVPDWLNVPGMREALQNKPAKGVAKGVLSNEDRLYAAKPIFRNGRLLGVLRMSITLKQFQRQFLRVILTVLGTLMLTLTLCAVISERLARNMARPIQAMRNFAMQVGRGHLGEKLNIRQNDELGQLAIELNRMSQRLASLDKERRAFLANVSHELRTPVSNVHVTLEALESGADEEPELRSRFIRTALDETTRLSVLIKDLLDLGRLEAGVAPTRTAALQPARPHPSYSTSGGVSNALQGYGHQRRRSDVQIQGRSRTALASFLNVLDNAIKHSVPDSMVFLSGKVESVQVAVQIRDQGPESVRAIYSHFLNSFTQQILTPRQWDWPRFSDRTANCGSNGRSITANS
jgi:signal transduction histidine kinase